MSFHVLVFKSFYWSIMYKWKVIQIINIQLSKILGSEYSFTVTTQIRCSCLPVGAIHMASGGICAIHRYGRSNEWIPGTGHEIYHPLLSLGSRTQVNTPICDSQEVWRTCRLSRPYWHWAVLAWSMGQCRQKETILLTLYLWLFFTTIIIWSVCVCE